MRQPRGIRRPIVLAALGLAASSCFSRSREAAPVVEAPAPVLLQQAGRDYPAAYVAHCDAPLAAADWKCASDDSTHVTEFPPFSLVVLDPALPVRLVTPGGARPVKVGFLDHDAKGTVVEVRADGALALAAADLARPRLLAGFDQESEDGLRKSVWVVQSADGYFKR
jgi:hypothetical protein